MVRETLRRAYERCSTMVTRRGSGRRAILPVPATIHMVQSTPKVVVSPRRPTVAVAILWIVLNTCGIARAGGIALTTPAGLKAGDSFRFVFITDQLTSGSSSNISYYNNFVNSQAGGATYDGALVSWSAIASTSKVNAIDNIGQSATPVYLADGTLITSSTTSTGLWSGSLQNPINEDLSGNSLNFVGVLTGTTTTGVASRDPLGNFFGVTSGDSGKTSASWVNLAAYPSYISLHVYGISQVLVATATVPEPSAYVMAGTAIIFGWACRYVRGRKQARASGQ